MMENLTFNIFFVDYKMLYTFETSSLIKTQNISVSIHNEGLLQLWLHWVPVVFIQTPHDGRHVWRFQECVFIFLVFSIRCSQFYPILACELSWKLDSTPTSLPSG